MAEVVRHVARLAVLLRGGCYFFGQAAEDAKQIAGCPGGGRITSSQAQREDRRNLQDDSFPRFAV